MKLIPQSHQDLIQDQTRALAILATIMDDGGPQSTPVWFDTTGELLRVNTARGRVKDKNMSQRPHVAVVILDPESQHRYIQIRGLVVDSKEEGAREHIDMLARKYLGQSSYQNYQGETRVLYLIEPVSVSVMG